MSRSHTAFACGSSTLAATLDTASANTGAKTSANTSAKTGISTGLLIVSGGNELRSGAFCGQAQLARRIAEAGFPVLRFDRRGIGDSEGENRGFRHSGADIRAAIAAFHALVPGLERVIALGNCDAASALMLNRGEGCAGLILSNPWVSEGEEETDVQALHLPATLRQRYAKKLGKPSEIIRLLRGDVDLGKLARGLVVAGRGAPPAAPPLLDEMAHNLAQFDGKATILIAEDDRIGQIFAALWDKDDARLYGCEGASHAYVEPHAREWLYQKVLSALRDGMRDDAEN